MYRRQGSRPSPRKSKAKWLSDEALQIAEKRKDRIGKDERERYILPGASVRNSARGKGHEEGGLAYTKTGSSLRSPPGYSQASTPKTRVCLLYCFALSPLTLRGLSPTTISLSLKRS